MKIDIVTIFPDYLAPLSLSLVGKAVSTGAVDLGVHDLRRWTADRHRTVDDTPYGGGAGMVMRPEPWGEALDELTDSRTRLLILTPAGRPFDQQLADELSGEDHLLLACGRYEGIDARVARWAGSRMRTEEVSIGDYVLNGGEAAALVIVEAVVRLLPGVLGNPESLTEESHGAGHDGLLEYPSFTKPPSWRGLDVPEVLLSGHHAQIAAWRRDRARELTRERRPDLLPAADRPVVIGAAKAEDAGELLTLQRAAFVDEGRTCQSFDIPPLTDTLAELRATVNGSTVLVARRGPRLVGSVFGRTESDGVSVDGTWYVGRLMVAPDQQGQGIGSALMAAIEAAAPPSTTRLRLFTGAPSATNLDFYTRRGYHVADRRLTPIGVEIVVLDKPAPGGPAPIPGDQ